jgi:YHS domain-containing protein
MSLILSTLVAGVLAFGAAAPAPTAADSFGGDPFPLDTCPVSGEKLGADAKTVVLTDMKDAKLNGTQMKFCCDKCLAAFKADPAKYMTKIDEAIVKAAPEYPLDQCLLMPDEKLADDAKTVVYQNRVYKLCCKKCVRNFEKDPAKWAKDFEKAVIAKQKPGYKATTCPISGKALGEGSVDVVVQNRLVRTCCGGCVDAVKNAPKKAISKVDAASKDATRTVSAE